MLWLQISSGEAFNCNVMLWFVAIEWENHSLSNCCQIPAPSESVLYQNDNVWDNKTLPLTNRLNTLWPVVLKTVWLQLCTYRGLGHALEAWPIVRSYMSAATNAFVETWKAVSTRPWLNLAQRISLSVALHLVSSLTLVQSGSDKLLFWLPWYQ